MQELERVTIANDTFYKIADVDGMRPFLMSLVSPDNHWMFISSNGGLTAGRKDAEYALFPYYTDDKLTDMAETTGSKTMVRVGEVLWEPFSIRGQGRGRGCRALYKSKLGNKLIFEERNAKLGLCFRYGWSTSNTYGFVRTAALINETDRAMEISLLDGLQNLLPYGVESALQQVSSNLVDAYKRSELHRESGLGIYALSAIIVDKAEPSEALKANVVWSHGLPRATHLLSSRQLDTFRQTDEALRTETDVKGEKGAYLLQKNFVLEAGEQKDWRIVANVNQDRSGVAALIDELREPEALIQRVQKDVAAGTDRLVGLVAAADGLQQTDDHRYDSRHFANVLFNIMRGGIFDDNYRIERADFQAYLHNANRKLAKRWNGRVGQLPAVFALGDLRTLATEITDPDFQRLATEYLPLKFSRRHGDPSRPWNRFSINTRHDDGRKILDYEGNWRDIFQNWETLAHAYPNFMEGMIHKFLNATTADGYNPYRVTKGGFDWETIEPDDPWSYIGYWGDHQLIYLLKFLEFQEKHYPGSLAEWYDKDLFVYADVPYRIKSYTDLLANPKDTIEFDHAGDAEIRQRRTLEGADGALVRTAGGTLLRANFAEKILVTLLAKIANFIPEGGIWMNTQRPEWNDANNALVGNGVSMVTLYYLRRFLSFLQGNWTADTVALGADLATFFRSVHRTLAGHAAALAEPISDKKRKDILDELGQAAEDYRSRLYANALTNDRQNVSLADVQDFLQQALSHVDHAIAANRRPDGLYHAYNLMTVYEGGVRIDYLNEMLEGQVAVLSAGYLKAPQVLEVLDAMKASKLFREDQYTYLLYPNKELPGFLEKNSLPPAAVHESILLQKMIKAGDARLVSKDINGDYHFNGNFRNAGHLAAALAALAETDYAELVVAERAQLLRTYEAVFNHKAFTGRSGTFYGYEGLGSIYWHMVSKLRLAVQECCLRAAASGAAATTLGR
ncbi:MAG: hypothetical protein AAFZ52_03335 [Bacteroidota bacterium]